MSAPSVVAAPLDSESIQMPPDRPDRPDREPSAFAIVALRETRDADGGLAGVRFTYRGRDIDATRDRADHTWRVRANGRDVGRVDVGETEAAHTVAMLIIGMLFVD